jgi:hypothetical protein
MHKIPKQLIPLLIIFVVVTAGLIAARSLLVPDTFGEYGHYRAAAVDEIAARNIVYAGANTCIDCHDDIYALKQDSHHKLVACEVCHGPAANHAEAPDEYIPDAPRGRKLCPRCHDYNPSRPTGFPQIQAEWHNPGKACMSCHNPHNPLLPQTPGECSACHRSIANVKLVSHHTNVPCTKCHNVPKLHLTDPRANMAAIPVSRETCSQCHAKDADSPREIPRIDLETHGERYLCWDCHYPHFPEAGK